MRTLKIISLCFLLGLSCKVYAQENRYYITFEQTSISLLTADQRFGCGDDYFYLEYSVQYANGASDKQHDGGYEGSYKNYKFSQKVAYSKEANPNTIALLGRAGDEDNEYRENSASFVYTKGMSPQSLNVNAKDTRGCDRGINATYKITIYDPVKITTNRFNGGNDACANTPITIDVGQYYSSGTVELQIWNKNNTWETITNITNTSSKTYRYADLSNYIDYGRAFHFRTKRALPDGSYSYCTYPANPSLVYYPEVSLPAGKSIKTSPECDGNALIHIPFEGTTGYIISVTGNNVKNYDSETLAKKDNYYILSDSYSPGELTLKIEYKGNSQCFLTERITVPNYMAYTVSNPVYPQKTGDYHIAKNGDPGTISFDVAGSLSSTVILEVYQNGNPIKSVTGILSSSQIMNDYSYYKGNVSVDIPAGTYDIKVKSDDCVKEFTNITLTQPDPVTCTVGFISPSCNAANLVSGDTGNGIIELSGIAGGIGNYRYSINESDMSSFSGNSVNITGLSIGTYKIVISDSYGNAFNKQIIIQPHNPITATLAIKPPSMSCVSDGVVTVSALGGTGQLLYSRTNELSKFTNNNVVSGYQTGESLVFIQDANKCIVSVPVSIRDDNRVYVVSTTPTAPVCNGNDDGTCVLVIGKKQGNLSVSTDVSSGNVIIQDNTITITGLRSGYHSCIIHDEKSGNTCDLDASFTVPTKEVIHIRTAVTPVNTNGGSDGQITVTPSGGNGAPYRILLLDVDSNTQLRDETVSGSFTFTGLTGAAANGGKLYRITVYDSKNCSATAEARITQPEPLSMSISLSRPVSCHDGNDAAVNLSGAGGNGEYQYSKDNVSWTANNYFAGLAAGVYTFYVKDKTNNMQSAQITIPNPAPLTLVRVGIADASVYGAADGWIRYKVSGGTYPYSLLPIRGTITSSIAGNDTLITVSGLPAGAYSFTAKDSQGCSSLTSQDTIHEPDRLTLTVSNVIQPTCGWDNGSLTAEAAGGVTPYTYTLAANDGSLTRTQVSASAAVFSGIPSGTYQVSVADNTGYSIPGSTVTFNAYTSPAVKFCATTDPLCSGSDNGQVRVTPTASTRPIASYLLYNTDSTFVRTVTGGIFDNLPAGDYKVDVFDENGCRSQTPYPVTLRDPKPISIAMDTVIPSPSKGEQAGKIVFRVQGGNTGSMVVRLYDANGQLTDSLSAITDVLLNFAVGAGGYSLEVIDSKGCTFRTGLLQITEPADPLHLIVRDVKDALCKSQTGSILVEGAGGWGGYRYKRAIEESYSTLNRFENLYPGTYLITVTDKMGATATEAITIHEPQDSLRVAATNLTLPTCGNNGKFSVSLSGGTPPYKLYENGNDTVFCEEPQIVEWLGKGSGAHLLHLTDQNACRFELEVILPETFLLRIENFKAVYPSMPGAADASLSATVKGGAAPHTYQWTCLYGALAGQTRNTAELKNIPSGYYRLEVSDAAGCSAGKTFYLGDPGDLRFTLLEKGDETSANAANGYAILSSEANIVSYEIISPSQTVSHYNSSSSDGHFSVRDDKVYLNNLESGKWTVVGITASGERVVIEFEILPYPPFGFGRIEVTNAAVPGGSNGEIHLEVSGGGGGNTFTWTDDKGNIYTSTDNENGSVLSGIPAGTYTIVVTDRYGNQITQTVEVREPAQALKLQLDEQQNQTCKEDRDAYVILSANGGWGDYQFSHYTGAPRPAGSKPDFHNTSVFPELTTGIHWFYVIDKAGAMDSLMLTVTEPEYLRASVASIDSVKCKDGSDGRIVFNITGGTAPYSFMEQGIGYWKTGNEAVNLKAGKHVFIFTDSNQCEGKDTLSVYVSEPDSLSFSNIAVTHTTCAEDNGKIEVGVAGGVLPYSYRWLDFNNQVIGTTSLISGLKQNALYRLEVSDKNGCTISMEQLINPSTVPQITAVETTDVLCYGETNGTARVSHVVPGTPNSPYTFTWSNGDTGESSGRFGAGRHSVTVRDENGCSSTSYFTVGQPDSLRLHFIDIREPHCFGYSDAYIHTETLGGAGGYTYLWSTGATTPHLDAIPKGDYWVQVTDSNGCTYRKSVSLNEPPYQTIDLGEDVLMCPGNTHVIDGGEYVSYRWFTDTRDISTDRYLHVNTEGHYYLEAKTPDGCSAWGDIGVAIGNNALIADFLLSSATAVGDTLVIFEISNMPLDSLRWEYDQKAFKKVENNTDEFYGLPYMLQLQCLKTGIYNIGLYAYSGGCYSPALKQVEIVVVEPSQDDWTTLQPLINSINEYPNPTDGRFTVELELREVADARFVLFNVASGLCVSDRKETGSSYYRLPYDLQNISKGVYVLIVTAGNERRQVKIIVK